MATQRRMDVIRRMAAVGLAVLIVAPAYLRLAAKSTAFVAARSAVMKTALRVGDLDQSAAQPAADTPTLLVTKLEDADDLVCLQNCSLRDAITVANSRAGDDVIGFAPGLTGTLKLNGVLPKLTTNIKILGPGAGSLIVSPKSGIFFRIFFIDANANVTLSGITITGGAPSADNLGGAGA